MGEAACATMALTLDGRLMGSPLPQRGGRGDVRGEEVRVPNPAEPCSEPDRARDDADTGRGEADRGRFRAGGRGGDVKAACTTGGPRSEGASTANDGGRARESREALRPPGRLSAVSFAGTVIDNCGDAASAFSSIAPFSPGMQRAVVGVGGWRGCDEPTRSSDALISSRLSPTSLRACNCCRS